MTDDDLIRRSYILSKGFDVYKKYRETHEFQSDVVQALKDLEWIIRTAPSVETEKKKGTEK